MGDYNSNLWPSERAALVGTIDPDAYTSATYTSDYVNMTEFESLMAVLCAGNFTTDGAVAGQLYEATSSSGAGATAISGKAITGLDTTGDTDKQAIINLRADELTTTGSMDWVALVVTITGTVDFGATLFGFDPHYGPASDNDLSSVEEIITT